MADSIIHHAHWIWLPDSTPHQYVCFRRMFELESLEDDASMEISVDSDFVLAINDREVGRGQFSDHPKHKTFTRYEIGEFLQPGRNTIAVLAYYRGADFSEYKMGEAGLIAALTGAGLEVLTDDSWRTTPHRAFAAGDMPRVSNQMGFTTRFDARLDSDWTSSSFDDRDWHPAVMKAQGTDGFWKSLAPRPVVPLVIQDPVQVDIVTQGVFMRTRASEHAADTIHGDALISRPPRELFARSYEGAKDWHEDLRWQPGNLIAHPDDQRLIIEPPENADGLYLILDLGREEVGWLTLSVEAPAGTLIDIAHGEHLTDGRVRALIHERRFADRYICREGTNRFTLPFRRLGARYIQVHFSRFDRPSRIDYIGLRPTVLPIERRGRFEPNDPLATRIHETSVRTLELCAHEHYEDCPWREQSLYAYDSRNQALFGYYAYPNLDFAATSFGLLGDDLRKDGLLELVAPGACAVNIPIFSLVWISAVAEHWLYSGRPTLFDRYADTAQTIIRTAMDRHDADTGLYGLRPDGGIWNFYEWTPGLVGRRPDESDEVHAGYNLYLHEALERLAWLREHAGDTVAAAKLRALRGKLGAAIHRAFWDDRNGCYATTRVNGEKEGAHEHIQVLALHENIVPKEKEPGLIQDIANRVHPEMTLSSKPYLVNALMARGPAARQLVGDTIERLWNPMTFVGATSYWETQMGDMDFDNAASLCHAWSSLPIYFYQGFVLGIRPLTPGFKTFSIRPYPHRFYDVSGTVPTPSGDIHLSWQRTGEGLVVQVEGPTDLKPAPAPFIEAPIAALTYNGSTLEYRL